MGNVLGFDFGTVDLKRSAYRPQGHADMDTELDFIRKGLVQTFLFQKNASLCADYESSWLT